MGGDDGQPIPKLVGHCSICLGVLVGYIRKRSIGLTTGTHTQQLHFRHSIVFGC